MADFWKAIPVVEKHEGEKFTDDPADPGGPTRCGITLPWAREAHLDLDHDGDTDIQDIRLLTWSTAAPLYKARIWDVLGLDRVVCQDVATKVFDLAVHFGPQRAVRYFQRALNACRYVITEDGWLGPKTLAAVNDCEPRELLLEVGRLQAEHYARWIARKPNREKYRGGLMHRASWPYTVHLA